MNSPQKEFKLLFGPVENIEKDDRISQLPDDLLHYILSFVEIFDVVGLSILSKRWKNLWTTMPFLDFDIVRFWEARFHPLPLNYPLVGNLRKFIDWVLIYQGPASLTRFRLCTAGVFDYEEVMRWIRIAARRNVQQLEIKCVPSEALFELPYSLCVSQGLRVLRLNLSKCVLRIPRNATFRQLKSLELERVSLTDEGLTLSFISRCSLLENLSLKNCIFHSHVLCIASASVKYLTIKCSPENDAESDGFCSSKLDISCPNLLYFSYRAPRPSRFTLGDLSSLEIMRLNFYPEHGDQWSFIAGEVLKILKEIVNIKYLWLKDDAMEGLVFQIDRIKCFKTAFQRLKSLQLSIGIDAGYTRAMFLLLKNCPSLELLTIVLVELQSYGDDWHWQLDDEGSNWWRYHLKSIQLVNFVNDVHNMKFVKFVLENGVVLENFNIVWMHGRTRSVAAEKLLLQLPKASPIVSVRFLEPSSIDVGRRFQASSILTSRIW